METLHFISNGEDPYPASRLLELLPDYKLKDLCISQNLALSVFLNSFFLLKEIGIESIFVFCM